MSHITFQIKGIEGKFVKPIKQEDDVRSILSQIKKDFGIIPELTARLFGSELQSSNQVIKYVRSQDLITIDTKEVNGAHPKL